MFIYLILNLQVIIYQQENENELDGLTMNNNLMFQVTLTLDKHSK